jgi:hypothetical protein
MKRRHEARQNGRHSPVPTGLVPDGHILAWLRERVRTTGQVPGRRQVIEKWALGSTRAERLRGIVIDEATNQDLASADQPTGHTPWQPLFRLGPLAPADRA